MRKIIFTSILSLLFIACQTPIKQEKEQTIELFDQLIQLMDQYAVKTLENGNVNSLALAIYKDGKVYHNYYGEIDPGANNKPNDSTVYELASISKVFIGSLVAQAVLEGKLSLSDKIQDYIGQSYTNLAFEGQSITIKHLLTHTLGFKERTPKGLSEVQNKISEGYYENNPFEYDFSDLLIELKTMKLDKKPGTFFEYNSIGPELLAYVLELVYERPYRDLLNDFLNERGMNHTSLLDFENHKNNFAYGYNETGKRVPFHKNPLIGGGGGMLSTLPDLIEFMKFQIESDHPIIKESTKELFRNDDDDVMGYLWQNMGVGEEEGFYYSKTGTSMGTQSGILICPDSKYGLILISNTTSDDAIDDWMTLFFSKMEVDLIKYPKLNLVSILKPDFIGNTAKSIQQFNELRTDTTRYFYSDNELNNLGYELLYVKKDENKAIQIFKLATEIYPENANLFDSLGEAYFEADDYKNALINYKKSIDLDSNNSNARKYILELEHVLFNQ